MTKTNKPQFTYRIGSLTATIWKNEAKHGSYYNTEIVRNYKDTSGNWQTTTRFSHDDLLNVAKLAERAEEYIARLSDS